MSDEKWFWVMWIGGGIATLVGIVAIGLIVGVLLGS